MISIPRRSPRREQSHNRITGSESVSLFIHRTFWDDNRIAGLPPLCQLAFLSGLSRMAETGAPIVYATSFKRWCPDDEFKQQTQVLVNAGLWIPVAGGWMVSTMAADLFYIGEGDPNLDDRLKGDCRVGLMFN